jgi:dTMP kinase
MALFITFEGGEGSGKSTQAKILIDRLHKQKKWGVSYFEEPGTTVLGRGVREWLRSPERPLIVIPGSGTQLNLPLIDSDNNNAPPAIRLHADSPRAELLAFTIARSQLVEEFIIPKLKGKHIVIGDRYADSTTAYQGYGRKLDLKLVEIANNIATQGRMPNLTILIDIPPEKGLVRKFGVTRHNFEKEELDFHKRIRHGYLELVRNEPERWLKIDGTQSMETISGIIWEKVKKVIASNN